MQAATMTREMVMTRTLDVDVEAARQLGRRLAVWAIIGVGVVATIWILSHMGSLAVYGCRPRSSAAFRSGTPKLP